MTPPRPRSAASGRAGARITFAGATLAERTTVVAELHERHGYDVIDPYDNPRVVAGQGTATAELLSQATAQGVHLDTVVVPIGGGSALAGACLATTGHRARVVGAEPENVPAFTAALRAGEPVTVPAHHTIADGLRPNRIGHLPFALARADTARVLTISEEAITDALQTALWQARLLIEPAAATALAAALAYARETSPNTDIGVLLTGGNTDPGTRHPPPHTRPRTTRVVRTTRAVGPAGTATAAGTAETLPA
ncbi:pyridoxal-phosphate dependent enzyme [Streptomyces sp. SBC-4]|nr:pyridoxal-phosphate dependent enzyme [Streptomyces sp. SBC-4]MDV5143308.1 pyridoxal-phosphate dependent enzyme [Streptomyces sp. SBC-4]